MALASGEATEAATLLSSAQQIFAELPPFLTPADEAEFNNLIQMAQQALDQERYAAAWQAGQQMTMVEALYKDPSYSLQNTPVMYINPTVPVAEHDWEVLRPPSQSLNQERK